MPPANITIRPGTAADADAISQVHYEALDQFHEFYGAFFKKHPREMLPLMTAQAFAKKEPAWVFYVAEEGDDVVGFVRYCFEEAKDSDEKKEKKEEEKVDGKEEGEKKKKKEEESPYACKEELKELWKAFNDAQTKAEETVENAAKGQRHMWIQHLMIRPSHQRRGIGHALLSTALQHADEQTLPAVIVSSAESVALYRKFGFVSQGSFQIDNGHWAREVARVQPGQASEMLVERYDGVFEVEDVMVRAALGREY
ncbi:hypothetical protein LMH87_007350 [Akanthomyces muscarius]|uniref:N-acetyltransferase domain-containing protein n=1 Tax=Akanthomyces muscarius TaxID=2231603 RepID=A0A9W8UTP6_AKAMU|nr:hypothetical protein LMH87_007350 [Akanthomyces muscarius]KAJ4165730.1 hypothetical protein LMH87_007350 [Akanthomyces muscarius]